MNYLRLNTFKLKHKKYEYKPRAWVGVGSPLIRFFPQLPRLGYHRCTELAGWAPETASIQGTLWEFEDRRIPHGPHHRLGFAEWFQHLGPLAQSQNYRGNKKTAKLDSVAHGISLTVAAAIPIGSVTSAIIAVDSSCSSSSLAGQKSVLRNGWGSQLESLYAATKS